MTGFADVGDSVIEPPRGLAKPNWSNANEGNSFVNPYDARIAIRPSPRGSHTRPMRGEKFASLSFQYPSPLGPPGSPRNNVPAGALTNRVLRTLLRIASSDR